MTGNTLDSPSKFSYNLRMDMEHLLLILCTGAPAKSGAFYCYGRSAFTENTNGSIYQVTGINEATPSITTDGGGWSGTDGSGTDAWNQTSIGVLELG